MPRAWAASMMRLKFAFNCGIGVPRRPSLAPSATMRIRTSPSRTRSIRFAARVDVSPDTPAFTTVKSRPAWSIQLLQHCGVGLRLADSLAGREAIAERDDERRRRGRPIGWIVG